LDLTLRLSAWPLSKKIFDGVTRNRFPAGFQAGKVLNFAGGRSFFFSFLPAQRAVNLTAAFNSPTPDQQQNEQLIVIYIKYRFFEKFTKNEGNSPRQQGRNQF
jgi:hypothetical protein